MSEIFYMLYTACPRKSESLKICYTYEYGAMEEMYFKQSSVVYIVVILLS